MLLGICRDFLISEKEGQQPRYFQVIYRNGKLIDSSGREYNASGDINIEGLVTGYRLEDSKLIIFQIQQFGIKRDVNIEVDIDQLSDEREFKSIKKKIQKHKEIRTSDKSAREAPKVPSIEVTYNEMSYIQTLQQIRNSLSRKYVIQHFKKLKLRRGLPRLLFPDLQVEKKLLI
ncbi:hypothetical protein pb186bvf_004640 [Paramecium bursaria]